MEAKKDIRDLEKDKSSEEEEHHIDGSMKQDDAKDTRKLLITVFVVIGIFAAIFLFSYYLRVHDKPAAPETRDYNNFEFTKEIGLWKTEWQLGSTVFVLRMHHGPWDLENVTVVGKLDDRFQDNRIFITFDPLGEDLSYIAISAGELGLNLYKAIQKYPVAACTANETDACMDRPIKTCDNTNASVIYLKSDPEEKIIMRGNCVIIQGQGMEIVRATERVLYQWYQIME